MNTLFLAQITPAQPLIDWSVPTFDIADIAIKLGLAAVLASFLGWERGKSDKPAGIRTMVLVSVGAATFVLLGAHVMDANMTGEVIRTDPTRVLAYVISGVGFLGAGAILHSKKTVKGLTTAASIWVVAAIGASCGLGEYALAIMVSIISFVSLLIPWVYTAITKEEIPDEDDHD
jgi:putative Mg2+ transporter-C (MgtC) family protein